MQSRSPLTIGMCYDILISDTMNSKDVEIFEQSDSKTLFIAENDRVLLLL